MPISFPAAHPDYLATARDRLRDAAEGLAQQAVRHDSAPLAEAVTELLAAVAHTHRASELLSQAVQR